MSNKEQSFMRTVAISTLDCLCPEAKATREARKAKEMRRMESFRQELQKIAGYNIEINITINGGCLEAVIDDLRFVAYEISSSKAEDHWTVVTLLGRCPSCGVETLSEPFHDLLGLGKMLEEFEPMRLHRCYAY
jgi:hypothetical protein